MMQRARYTLLVGLIGACAAAPAIASCPPLSAYRVSSVSAEKATIETSMRMLVSGTAWSSEVLGRSEGVTVSFRGVTGPLDQVLSKVVEGAGQASSSAVSMVSDPQRCLVTVTVTPPAQEEPIAVGSTAETAPAAFVDVPPAVSNAAPVADTAYTPEVLRAGGTLSEALSDYAERKGWSLRWQLDDDYMLDVDVPIPPMSLVDGMTYVVRAYQSQGGLIGVVPRFARSNKVVVIEKMNVRERGL